MRRNHGGVFKAKVAVEAVKGEPEVKQLHAKIGELTMENDFLSVALGRIGGPSAKK